MLQRLAVEERPDEAGVGRRDDPANLRMPALEGGERAGDRGAVSPVLAVPFVVLGPADEIEEAAARDKVMHQMRAGADPGLRAELEAEVGDALDRNQPSIGDAAGKTRRLRAEECLAHRRMEAVGANQHIGRMRAPFANHASTRVAAIGEADEAVAEMDAPRESPWR